MNAIKKAINTLHVFMTYFAILQLLAMTIIVSTQVFCRFVLGFSISWAEEVALILVIWFSMISMAIGVKLRLHIYIELFTMKFSEKIKKNVILKITDAATLIFGGVMVYYGILLVQNGMTSTLPGIGLTSSTEYIFVPIAGAMIVYDSFMYLFNIEKDDDEFEHNLLGGEHQNA